MNREPLDYFLLTMATWHAVETWRHGAIFDESREAMRYCRSEFFAYLSQCMFCLSLWVAATVFLFSEIPYITVFSRFVIWTLAIARGANVLNDVTHAWGRTPKKEDEEDDPFTDTSEHNRDSTASRRKVEDD